MDKGLSGVVKEREAEGKQKQKKQKENRAGTDFLHISTACNSTMQSFNNKLLFSSCFT